VAACLAAAQAVGQSPLDPPLIFGLIVTLAGHYTLAARSDVTGTTPQCGGGASDAGRISGEDIVILLLTRPWLRSMAGFFLTWTIWD
jgi:hypothetical protein